MFDPQALIQQYQEEIAELKAQLREFEAGGVAPSEVRQCPHPSGRAVWAHAQRQKNEAMEHRLAELKSMILTSVNVTTNAETNSPVSSAQSARKSLMSGPAPQSRQARNAASELRPIHRNGASRTSRPVDSHHLYPRCIRKAHSQLQEDLHAAQAKLSEQEDEIAYLKAELAKRPVDIDKRVEEMEDEIGQLKMIAGESSSLQNSWAEALGSTAREE